MSIAYSGDLGKRASGGQIPASGPLPACEPWARATLPGTEQILTGWFSLISVVGSLPQDQSLPMGVLGLAELSQVPAGQPPSFEAAASRLWDSVSPPPGFHWLFWVFNVKALEARDEARDESGAVWPKASIILGAF